MGQKVHPTSIRLGYIKDWSSQWFAKKKDFANLLHEDIKIRRYIKTNFSAASISKIEITRASNRVKVSIHTARPGVIIGRKGADIDRLRDELQDMTQKEIYIEIKEIKNPAAEAQLIAEQIAFQLERRIAFRRAMKRALQLAMDSGGIEGIRMRCAGRLGGAEIARKESYKAGRIPLQTFRADIDFGFAEAHTTYGLIGVKVWVCKGEVLPKKEGEKESEPQEEIRG